MTGVPDTPVARADWASLGDDEWRAFVERLPVNPDDLLTPEESAALKLHLVSLAAERQRVAVEHGNEPVGGRRFERGTYDGDAEFERMERRALVAETRVQRVLGLCEQLEESRHMGYAGRTTPEHIRYALACPYCDDTGAIHVGHGTCGGCSGVPGITHEPACGWEPCPEGCLVPVPVVAGTPGGDETT